MAKVRCPQCGKPNPDELDTCQFCGALLKPPETPSPENPPAIRPGEEPVKKNTAEFDKVTLSASDKAPIHPGEAPTKKNTAELERILPSWLRNLRGKQEPASSEPPEQLPAEANLPPADEGLPPAPVNLPPLENSNEGLPDWITGIGSNTPEQEEEEVPDWLSSLRSGGGTGADLPSSPEPAPEHGGLDLKPDEPRLKAVQPPPPPPASAAPASSEESGLPDWLNEFKSKGAAAEETGTAARQEGEASPDWLSGIPSVPAEQPAAPPEVLPDWVNKLEGTSRRSEAPDQSTPAVPSDSVPDWISKFQPESSQESAAPAENVPDWLSNLEDKAGAGASVPVSPAFIEEPSVTPESSGESPDWLAKLQADVGSAGEETRQGEYEVAPPAEPNPSAALPDWLSNVEQTGEPANGTPALIVGSEERASGEAGEAAFSVETPDWLSKLTPDQAGKSAQPGTGDETQSPDSLQPADLPSWVQAMRPVEAVVDEAKAAPAEANQETEQGGPLAGLRAVLPTGPGLGPLRKPPAYSVKLQTTDSQQRYAAHLEKLISTETVSQAAKSAQPGSGGLLRLIIALVLLVVLGVPIISKAKVTPSDALYPPEMSAAFGLMDGLPADSPVLVAFDYEPALSGELEAAAAPVLDHLLLKGARFAFISTSPTGPVLAEHFMLTLRTEYGDVTESRYLNLGYLAGGPAGVLSFANDPRGTAPYTVDGILAWQTFYSTGLPQLTGVQKLSDFGAVLVLTDSPDSARVWIEQAGPMLGATPMAMVISAQAEPMVRPYYDSGQIKGLVTGLAGGKAYEQTSSRPGLGSTYWNALSAGLLALELLIVVGGLWGLIVSRIPGKSKSGGKA